MPNDKNGYLINISIFLISILYFQSLNPTIYGAIDIPDNKKEYFKG